MIKRSRRALLTGASLETLAGAGVPCNTAPLESYGGREISGVWYDESAERFRGLEAQAFCDDLALGLCAGDPF
jgi:hypothetical protein